VLLPSCFLLLQYRSINFAEAASSGIGLIIAGNDTSGLGVSALLATLPLFPDVVEKLRQEQQQVTYSYSKFNTIGKLSCYLNEPRNDYGWCVLSWKPAAWVCLHCLPRCRCSLKWWIS
jgi:cytochrome P450